MLPGQVGAVLDVGDDDQRAHGRHQRLVPVGVVPLVLDEVARLEHLADVVEIGPHAHQQALGADAFGRRLGDRSHVDRVVVGARGAADQLLQQRMGHVAQFQQADIGLHAEQAFDERQQPHHQQPGEHAPQPEAQRIGPDRSPSGWAVQRLDADRGQHGDQRPRHMPT